MPQLASSVEVSTQVPSGQTTRPGPHEVWQLPFMHEPPGPQLMPHPPQFVGSLAVFTHAPLQSCSPGGQVQAPLVQVWPGAHTLVQLPQCFGSVPVSTQALPHWVFPGGQPHTPLVHARPGAHALPQVPQLAVLVFVSTHCPLQSV